MPTQGQLVRDWAKEQGYEVGIRGRIAPAIWTAYAEAHEDFEREVPNGGGVHCPGCGRRWTGLRECHCRRCHCHFSTVANFDGHLFATEHGSKCVNPLDKRVKAQGARLREKETVWGTIYVQEGDHWKTDSTDLFD